MTSEHTAYDPQSMTGHGSGFTHEPPPAQPAWTSADTATTHPGAYYSRTPHGGATRPYAPPHPPGGIEAYPHRTASPGQFAFGPAPSPGFPRDPAPPYREGTPDEISEEEHADALLRNSSLGQPGVVEISRRTSEDDAAEIMRRLHARSQPVQTEAPPEYAFENWVDRSRELPHALMNVGYSYARQQFNHRAELCFRAALKAGHPDAATALAALPRGEDGMVLAGQDHAIQDIDGSATDTPIAPIDQQTMSFMEEGLHYARTGSPGRARLAWSIGWALDMKAV